jgi:uncharacterized protein (TIGR03435 family)
MPAFEVTSVKPVIPGAPGHGMSAEFGCAHGNFVSNYNMLSLLAGAWNSDLEKYRIFGTPAWTSMSNNNYLVEARAGSPVSEDECRLMVRILLADRFHISVHHEERTLDAYALVVAPHGPKMKQVTDPEAPANGTGFTIDGLPNWVFDSALKGWTMAQLAHGLFMARLELPIVDRTGLEGIYRINLSFHVRGTPGDGSPDVTTALREQMGLQLVRRKEVIDVIFVDHCEPPDPN